MDKMNEYKLNQRDKQFLNNPEEEHMKNPFKQYREEEIDANS